MTTAPQRVLSLVPSTTESVVALVGSERLVGCTRYCTEPRESLLAVARVGGTKNPQREAIVRLQPDLVLGNAEENRGEDLHWLAARVPVLVQTPTTVVESLACLRELSAVLQAAPSASALCADFAASIDALQCRRTAPLRVLYLIWRKPWMSVNHTTYIHDALRLAGADNVVVDASVRYPEIDLDEVRALAPAAVLLPDEPWRFDLTQLEELRAAGTFGAARLALCDGRDFCWHGVRAAAGLRRAAALIDSLRE